MRDTTLFWRKMDELFGERALIGTTKAEKLSGFSRQWLCKLATAGKIRFQHNGTRIMFTKDDIIFNHEHGWRIR